MVARRFGLSQIEHGELSVKANGGPRDQRFAVRHTSGVDGVTRAEVVAAIEHDIGGGDPPGEGGAGQTFADRMHAHFRVDGAQRVARRFSLGCADGVITVDDLALQIGQIDGVAVADGQRADPGRGEIQRDWRAKAARTNDEGMRSADFFLPFDTDIRQQDMAAVAQQLLIVHGDAEGAYGVFQFISAAWWRGNRRPPVITRLTDEANDADDAAG